MTVENIFLSSLDKLLNQIIETIKAQVRFLEGLPRTNSKDEFDHAVKEAIKFPKRIIKILQDICKCKLTEVRIDVISSITAVSDCFGSILYVLSFFCYENRGASYIFWPFINPKNVLRHLVNQSKCILFVFQQIPRALSIMLSLSIISFNGEGNHKNRKPGR